MSCSLSPDTGGLEALLQDIKVALSEAQAVRGDAKELQIVAQRLVDEVLRYFIKLESSHISFVRADDRKAWFNR